MYVVSALRRTVAGRCLNGRRAAGNQRPRHHARAIDRCAMQPLGAGRVMMLLELLESRVKRTQGMTEETVIGLSRCGRRRVCADGVGALVVRDRNRGARHIVRAFCVRQRNGAGTQAGQQQKRDTSTLNPRRTAEHSNQLSDRAVLRQALADWQIGRWAD